MECSKGTPLRSMGRCCGFWILIASLICARHGSRERVPRLPIGGFLVNIYRQQLGFVHCHWRLGIPVKVVSKHMLLLCAQKPPCSCSQCLCPYMTFTYRCTQLFKGGCEHGAVCVCFVIHPIHQKVEAEPLRLS